MHLQWYVFTHDASSALYLTVWNLSAPWGQIPLPFCSSQGSLHRGMQHYPCAIHPPNDLFSCCCSVIECRKGKPSATIPLAASAQFRRCRHSLASQTVSEGDAFGLRVASSRALEQKRIFARKASAAWPKFKVKV